MIESIKQYFINEQLLHQAYSIALVLLIIVAVNISVHLLLKFLSTRDSTSSAILTIFYTGVKKPLKIIMWIIGLWFILTQILTWEAGSLVTILAISAMVVKVLVILCIVWALFAFAAGIKAYWISQKTATDDGYNDYSLIETCYKAFQALVIVLAFFTILSALEIPIAVFAGFTTVIAGFIAVSQQELIKNIFSGFLLYLDRPFSIGDWIYTSDGSIEGTVEKISFRLTQIRRFDKRPMYIPNSVFAASPVINASRMTNRRILQYIGVRYDDFHKLSAILSDIKQMLATHSEIDQTKTTLVCMVDGKTNMGSSTEGAFGAYAINFMVYTFTKTTNWTAFQEIQNQIMLEIGKIIEQHEAQIAFPTTNIELLGQAPEITHN
jgi:MscS family membrane protein